MVYPLKHTEDLIEEWKPGPQSEDDDYVGKLNGCTWRPDSVSCFSHSRVQSLPMNRMEEKMREINLKVPKWIRIAILCAVLCIVLCMGKIVYG